MSYTKSNHFIKTKLNEESSLGCIASDFERDDDDPLSIRSLSITFLGITLAFLTFVLPSISILLVRPLSEVNEVTSKQDYKKDGP